MKKLIILILCAAFMLTLFACSGEKILVGVSMPTDDSADRWLNEGELIKKGLEKSGYKVDLQYSDNTFATQMMQIESMIKAGAKAIVITAVDSNTLKTVLEEAAKAEVFIILHDRIINEVLHITAYSTFNHMYVGALQAAYIIAALELETTDGKFNMEIFSGPTYDPNAYQIYGGAVSIFGQYMASGALNIVSGQSEYIDTVIADWSRQGAYDRMKNLLANEYKDKDIHAVFAASDELAAGVIDALDEAGRAYPIIITGQGVDASAVKNIIDGKQTMTVFKDPKALAERTVILTDQILSGKEVETTTVSNNGAKAIPTYETLLSIVDHVSYKEVLIDSGLYKESDFK